MIGKARTPGSGSSGWRSSKLTRRRSRLATGVRIGEALATFWEDVDLEAGTVVIRWKVVRIRGVGLRRVQKLKTESGDRTLPLPSWAVAMLKERRRIAEENGRGPATPVFPDTLDGLRAPSNPGETFAKHGAPKSSRG